MDGQAARSESTDPDASPVPGYKTVRHLVIDIDAPGMREAISDAVDRINRSEEAEHMLAELDVGVAENWKLLPE